MTFKNLFIEHERSSEAEEWVAEELAEQSHDAQSQPYTVSSSAHVCPFQYSHVWP